MAEKYVGAMLGFFLKLLFCTICIFLMLYSFITLSNQFTQHRFMAEVEQMVLIIFSCLLIFYLCKSAPALAQSLLSGSPSLSAAGAIGAVTSAVGGALATGRIAGNVAGAGLRTGLGASGAIAQAAGSFSQAQSNSSSQSPFRQALTGSKAFAQSIGGQALEAAGDKASNITRSLINRPLMGGSGGSSGGVGDPGSNPNDIRQQLLNKDGSRKSYAQFYSDRFAKGESLEKKRESLNEKAQSPEVESKPENNGSAPRRFQTTQRTKRRNSY
jgi:type IV secretory pathway TrbL component